MLLLARFKVKGHSMEPKLRDGEEVIVSQIPYWFKKPQINDIVAFKNGASTILIKRIIKSEQDGYFVQGDNPKDSYDSRSFGKIFKNQIAGKIIYKL